MSGCCGARRQALAHQGNGSAPRIDWARAAAPLPSSSPSSPGPTPAVVALRYVGGDALALRGPSSGRVYRVAPQARALDADPRDVEALLRTALFVRA